LKTNELNLLTSTFGSTTFPKDHFHLYQVPITNVFVQHSLCMLGFSWKISIPSFAKQSISCNYLPKPWL